MHYDGDIDGRSDAATNQDKIGIHVLYNKHTKIKQQ